jgi:hypothetical protein
MASAADRLKFILEVDANGAVKGFQDVGKAADKELGKAESKLDKVGAGMTKFGAGAMAAAGVVGVALMKTVKAAEAQQLAELKLQNTIKNMPKLAGESADQFLELASAIQKTTVAGDEQVISAMAMLGTFNLTAEEVKGATPLVVDYARKFNIDLVNAATQVGKALDGQIGALKKNGVSIDEARYKTDRYGAVLEALSSQVGGFAEAEAQTFSGQVQQMKNQLGDLAEAIGQGVIPVFSTFVTGAGRVVDAFDGLSPQVKTGVGTFAALGTATLGAAGALSFTAGQFIKHRERFRQMFTTMSVDGVRSLTMLGKAMTGVGVAVAAVSLAYAIHKADQAEVARRAKDIAAALRAENQERTKNLQLLADSDKTVGDFILAMETLGVTTDDLNQFLAGNGGKVAELAEQYDASLLDIVNSSGAWSWIEEKIGLADSKQNEYLQTLKLFVEQARAVADEEERRVVIQTALNEVTGESVEITEDEADATKTAADSIKDKVAALRESARAYEESKKKVEDFIDAQRAAFDTTFALERATYKAEEAIWDYKDAVENSDLSEQAKTEAQREAEQAILDLAYQTAKSASEINVANGGIAFSAEEMAARQVSALDGIIAYLGPEDPLRKRLEEFRNALMDIPEVHSTKIYLDTAEADRELQQFRNRTGQPITVPVVPVGNPGSGGGRKFARGTSFAPGGVALVGEEGPELVELPAGARVHTANQTARMANGTRGVSSGGSVTINVTALDPQQAADAVIDAIQQYERRNGPGWRR